MLSPLSPEIELYVFFIAAGEVTNEYKQHFYSEQLFRTKPFQEIIALEALTMNFSHLILANMQVKPLV